MTSKTLPGIYDIHYLPMVELVIFPKKIIAPGDTISAIGNWQTIQGLIPLASCVTTNEQTDNGMIYTTTVEGTIIDQDNGAMLHFLANKYHAFIIHDIYKQKYLIGTDKKPAPEFSFQQKNEEIESGVRAVTFQITWISTIPPTPLVLL